MGQNEMLMEHKPVNQVKTESSEKDSESYNVCAVLNHSRVSYSMPWIMFRKS
jgi:hypothetical protein